MKFAVLSSGSKANSTYIEAGDNAILIDCGLSARECRRRMESNGIDASRIRAILITHEHSDHIRGISVLSRQLKVPVYANKLTAAHLNDVYAVEHFKTGQSFRLADFEVEPFSIVHDADDPVGFAVHEGLSKLVQLTDLGRITALVRRATEDCNAIVLESNYDPEKLKNCDYPWDLKQRIKSAHGHLSNNDAAAFLSDIRHSYLSRAILGHLSENSNSPELVLNTFSSFVDFSDFKTIECASVLKSTQLMSI
jgi:phosphoribosyl 1,2-cyclic phosphodiesterase